MVFGREGDYVLANGRRRPDAAARPGAPQRWRIVNAAKSRFFYLDLDGQPFTVIGSDGGIAGAAVDQRHPARDARRARRRDRDAERQSGHAAHVAGDALQPRLRQRRVPQRRGRADDRVHEGGADRREAGHDCARHSAAPTVEGATPVDIVLTLPPMKNNKSEFQVNGVPFWKAKPYSAKLGEKQLWIVKNESDWDHPFHLHGFFFQVIDEKGQPVRPLAWKDTVNVPMKTTVQVAGDVRRASRRVDVSLPHPRSRRRRPDGHGRRWRRAVTRPRAS